VTPALLSTWPPALPAVGWSDVTGGESLAAGLSDGACTGPLGVGALGDVELPVGALKLGPLGNGIREVGPAGIGRGKPGRAVGRSSLRSGLASGWPAGAAMSLPGGFKELKTLFTSGILTAPGRLSPVGVPAALGGLAALPPTAAGGSDG